MKMLCMEDRSKKGAMETQNRKHPLRIVKFKNDIIEVLGLNSSPVGRVSRGKDKGKGDSGDPHPRYSCAAAAGSATLSSL